MTGRPVDLKCAEPQAKLMIWYPGTRGGEAVALFAPASRNALLSPLFDAGFRMMSPVHLHNNEVGCSSTGMEDDTGLTEFGRAVIRHMDDE